MWPKIVGLEPIFGNAPNRQFFRGLPIRRTTGKSGPWTGMSNWRREESGKMIEDRKGKTIYIALFFLLLTLGRRMWSVKYPAVNTYDLTTRRLNDSGTDRRRDGD
jgi:hypothetical protein